MSDFISQFAASSEGIFEPIKYVFDELFKVASPLVEVAKGASKLIGMFASEHPSVLSFNAH